MATLGSGNNNINIDGAETSFIDFGGNDTYTIIPSLSANVTITDNQASTINLPAGMDISAANFSANGVQFTVNGFTVTFIGNPSLFTFVFGGDPVFGGGTPKTFTETAVAFGTTVPAPGDAPNAATQTGPVDAGGTVGQTLVLTASANSVDEGASVDVSLTDGMANTDYAYTITGVDATDIDLPLTGTFTTDANGAFTGTINALADRSTEGFETMTISIDGTTQSVAVDINDTSLDNAAPVITADATLAADEDTAATFSASATDVEDGAVAVTATAANGTVADNGDGTFTYTGNQDFNGTDTITLTSTDADGATTTQDVAVTVAAVADFTITANPSVNEGTPNTFTVTLAQPAAAPVTITAQLANGTTSNDDFGAGSFNPITLAFAAGETSKTFDITALLDGATEQPETYTVTASTTSFNGETQSASVTLLDGAGVGGTGQTFTLTAGADDFSPTSSVPGSITTPGNDTFLAGSVQGGGAHTLGAADSIDGGNGLDTLKITEDRAPAPGNTLFPRMSNVENVEIQALTAATVDFTNTTGVETIRNSQSVASTTINNLVDDAKFQFFNTTQGSTVNYFNINNADTTADVVFDTSVGADLSFGAGATPDAITTLNIALNNGTYNIGTGNVISGLNQTGNLSNVVLTGNATATTVDQLTGANGLTANVTNFDASSLQGTLGINLLGNNNDMTFKGAVGNNVFSIGQGNLAITLQDGDDVTTISSTGLDGNDSQDGAGGNDTFEIHFNDTAGVNGATGDSAAELNAAGDVISAINNVTNTERLVIDVWAQNANDTGGMGENVNFDRSLITSQFNTFTFDDTRTDGAAPQNNVQDADISGKVLVTNALGTDGHQIAVDQVGEFEIQAAAGQSILNVTHLDANVAGAADQIGTFTSSGAATTNLMLNADGEAYTLGAGGAGSTQDVTIDGGAALNMMGSAANITTLLDAAGEGATFNFSGLTTLADRDAMAPSVNTILVDNNGFATSVTGTEQDDNITGNGAVDTISGGSGDDIITGGAGNDILSGGEGNDVLNAGDGTANAQLEGVDNLNGGAGNDTFNFTFSANAATEGLTSADTVTGGTGIDGVVMRTADAVIGDQVFTGFNSIESFTLAGGNNTVTINQLANNNAGTLEAGSTFTINAQGGGNDTLNVGEGFSSASVLNVGAGITSLNAGLSTGAITLNINAGNLDDSDNLSFGRSTADTLNIISDGGSARLGGVQHLEVLRVIDDMTAGQTTTVTVDDNLFDTNNNGPVDAFTVDGSAVADDNLILDATAVDNATNAITLLGGAGSDKLFGTQFNDTLTGNAGSDLILGGGGADNLTGGTGSDLFRYVNLSDSAGTTVDTITDFVSGAMGDRIQISTNLLSGLQLQFAGNQSDFGAAQGATTANDGFVDYVFQTDTNTLWVDVNNDGALNANDLQIKLSGVSQIAGGDVVAVNLNAPTIGMIATDDAVNSAEAAAGLNITGTGAAGATVTVAFDSGRVLTGGNTALVDANGNWTLAVDAADVSAFGQGGETVTAFQTLTDGTVSVTTNRSFNVDTVVPVATIDLADASDSGASNSDDLTNIQTVTINGTAEAGSTVVISGGAANVTATATAGGTYSAAVILNANAVNNLSAVATDAAGNASTAATLAVTHDNTAPATPAFTINDNVGPIQGGVVAGGRTDDNTLMLTGTVADANDRGTVTVFANGIQVGTAAVDAASGGWTLTTPTLTDGALTFTAALTDPAGNTSIAGNAQTVSVDTVAPAAPALAVASATGIQNSTLNAGDTVTVTASFGGVTNGDALVVTGTPQLALNIGGTVVQAAYDAAASNLTTGVLGFTYTILAGQTDADGISIDANALNLNGGTIRDTAGNDAIITSVAVADNGAFKVDTTAPTPTITAVDFTNVGAGNNFGQLTITGTGFGASANSDSIDLSKLSFGAINLGGVVGDADPTTVASTIVTHTDASLVISFIDDGFVAAMGRFTDSGAEALDAQAGAFVDAAGNLSANGFAGDNVAALVSGNVSAAVANSGQITNALRLDGQDRDDTLVGDATNDTVFRGNGGNDVMTGGAGVVDTFIFSSAATNGTDTINAFDFGGTATDDDLDVSAVVATLAGAGLATVATGASALASASKVLTFDDSPVGTLDNLSAIADFLNTDVDPTAAILNRLVVDADATAGNANTILLIDNGANTGVYLFSDDAVVNNTVEASELTHLATLVGVGDARDVLAADFVGL